MNPSQDMGTGPQFKPDPGMAPQQPQVQSPEQYPAEQPIAPAPEAQQLAQQSPQPSLQQPPQQPFGQPQELQQASPFFAAAAATIPSEQAGAPLGGQVQTPAQPHQAVQSTSGAAKKLPLKKIFVIGGIIAGLLALLGAGWLIYSNFADNKGGSGENNVSAALYETDSFFAPNNDATGWAIFDSKTEQRITDFIFTYPLEFINNTSIVNDKAGREYGIVKDDGTMLVEFGEYKRIERAGTLYTLESKSGEAKRLINHKGKDVKIPGGGARWTSYTPTDSVASSGYDSYDQRSTSLYPVIDVRGDENTPGKEYLLNYSGKEILSSEKTLSQASDASGAYTVVSSADVDYIMDNNSQKVIGTYADVSTAIWSLDDVAVFSLEPKGYDKNAVKHVIAKGGKITGEFVATGCQYIRPERLPSDGSVAIRCGGVPPTADQSSSRNRLIGYDGTASADAHVFYNKDTYLIMNDKKKEAQLYKDGALIKTVAACNVLAGYGHNGYYATFAGYVLLTGCAPKEIGSNTIIKTDGTVIKSDGAEWDLGPTLFNKDGVGIAPKRARVSYSEPERHPYPEQYLLNTSLEVQKGPFGPGEFYTSQGQSIFVSRVVRKTGYGSDNSIIHPAAIYSGDFSKKLFESPSNFYVAKGETSILGSSAHSTLFAPTEVRLFKKADDGTYSYLDVVSGKEVASKANIKDDDKGHDLEFFYDYMRLENKESRDYFFLSGNPVPKK